MNQGHDLAELKLLLGGEIVSRWHWGSNLVWEHETGGARETSNEWTIGISYSARDTRLGVGVETQLALVNAHRSGRPEPTFEKSFLIGPSIQ